MAETVYYTILDDQGVKVIEINGGEDVYVELARNDEGGQHKLQEPIKDALSQALGYHVSNNYGFRFPIVVIQRYWANILQEAEEYDVTIPELFKKYMEDKVAERRRQLEENAAAGVIEFEDLAIVFEPGAHVVFQQGKELIGGIFRSLQVVQGFSGIKANITMNVISNISGFLAETPMKVTMSGFHGLKPTASLPIRMATEEEKKKLTERGRVYRSATSGARYMQYSGQLTQNAWWGAMNFRADGRVMLDIGTFAQTDSNKWHTEVRAVGIEQASREHSSDALVISEDKLWLAVPWVFGFSFQAKQWGRMNVDGLSEIAWRDDSWDKLVLAEEEKELVKALVEHHGDSFSDIVDEKGGGVIFLLHGPPGEGKTLTMETIAELLHKPLYRVSVGELGTNPDQLEERLRSILDIATVWDAVVGLDEADIFLAKRDKNDILRNAMVGVFLRLTEYHQGVLFLTTNLVDQLDEAFESRISVQIEFAPGTQEKRRKIWTNLLDAARVENTALNPAELSSIPLNGRQIKNVIRLSQTLSKARGVPLSKDIVEKVVSVTQRKKKKLGLFDSFKAWWKK